MFVFWTPQKTISSWMLHNRLVTLSEHSWESKEPIKRIAPVPEELPTRVVFTW